MHHSKMHSQTFRSIFGRDTFQAVYERSNRDFSTFLVFCCIILLNIEEVVFKSCSNLAIMHFGKIRNQPL